MSPYFRENIQERVVVLDDLDVYKLRERNPMQAMDQLVSKLKKDTPKRVYLALRQNYWHGHGDLRKLASLTSSGMAAQAYGLLPLSVQEARHLLASQEKYEESIIQEFIQAIRKDYQLYFLFDSPRILTLSMRHYQKERSLPSNPKELMARVFKEDFSEDHEDHQHADPNIISTEPYYLNKAQLIAGQLCAALYFTAHSAYKVNSKPASEQGSDQAKKLHLKIQDAVKEEDRDIAQKILKTSLFRPIENLYYLCESALTDFLVGCYLSHKSSKYPTPSLS